MAKFSLKGHVRSVQGFELLSNGSGDPVLVSKHFEDRATDQSNCVSFELDVTSRIELVDALDEADDAGANEVFPVETTRHARDKSSGRDLNQIRIMVDQVKASLRVLVDLKVDPSFLKLFW